MEFKTIIAILLLNISRHGLCQTNEEPSGEVQQTYFDKDPNAVKPKDLLAIESQQKLYFSQGPINNNPEYLQKKVTTNFYKPKITYQIGKPIYAQQFKLPTESASNVNWIKSPVKSINLGHQQIPSFNYVPQIPNLKGHGVTKQLNNLIPNNFGLHTNSPAPVYDLDFGKFKVSSDLSSPQIAPPQIPSKKPTETYFSPDAFKTQNIGLDSGNYKLDLPKQYNVQTLQLEQSQPQVHQPSSNEGSPVRYATFVPGVNEYDGKTPEHFENYQNQRKSGEANSYVKVTNGKTTYFYQIRHLVNKH